ncbi:ferredoxin [Amycolatopsis sp. WGS_07]|uniref:ferredoxin n=1 Tax=Amycolatopsis sp. WGS_07 TaxID=3076764 RepID=UPI003872E7FB
MRYAVEIDREICNGYGNCVLAAPDVFDLDDEDYAVVRPGRPTPEDVTAVAEAVDDCPMRAIRLRRDPGDPR